MPRKQWDAYSCFMQLFNGDKRYWNLNLSIPCKMKYVTMIVFHCTLHVGIYIMFCFNINVVYFLQMTVSLSECFPLPKRWRSAITTLKLISSCCFILTLMCHTATQSKWQILVLCLHRNPWTSEHLWIFHKEEQKQNFVSLFFVDTWAAC